MTVETPGIAGRSSIAGEEVPKDLLPSQGHTIPILVFSDLDGTLIDHHSYDFSSARPALDALRDLGAGVVLSSSKTAAEIAVIREAMGLSSWPAIVENGAGVLEARAQPDDDQWGYQRLRSLLDALPETLRSQFIGFGDMSAEQLVEATGLTVPAAKLAKQRSYSEPGLWTGKKEDRQAFLDALAEHGVSARSGGRFLTLSFGGTKADQMLALIRRFDPCHTVALGDAPNDVEMLETADHGFVVANPDSPELPELDGETAGRIQRTKLAGPAGWNAAILELLYKLELT
ncbi:HAD-IIB family hydrolase [Qingshengfaniella alkalisoli]|uniref:HAD-IIB family hydrolase n=1 Tax=Qingshengfaniella alkalisoli TaxID=2599296 RepID=A0A5B8IBB5_9RHOB|nr:HAD-IIB family hydrolase [Qingshengfaniella alkalisoli]QDY71469.1 HAD-IIB family hydrolase [Qingshengfaniella alkalisoli]